MPGLSRLFTSVRFPTKSIEAAGERRLGDGEVSHVAKDAGLSDFDVRFSICGWSATGTTSIRMLDRLYGEHAGLCDFRDGAGEQLRKAWAKRPRDLKWQDLKRDLEPDWFQRPGMTGYVFYIDRFAGTLAGVRESSPYLKELGITYVHFMPCLKPRPGDSDGGYSVMDYRQINPAFGTMEDFEAVARRCAQAGHQRSASIWC